MTAIAIINLLNLVPQFVAAGLSISDAWARVKAKADQFIAEDRDPTDAEWAELNTEIAAKRAELHG